MHTFIHTRYSNHPSDVKKYDTEQLREHFVIESLFSADEIHGVYSLNDRLIVGGIFPQSKSLELETVDQLKSTSFLERREIGIINVGASCTIDVNGESFTLNHKEALYIGKGAEKVVFHPSESGDALLYFNSAPAHTSFPTTKVDKSNAEIVELGSAENSNARTIYKLIVNSVVSTCQLQMGMTELKTGSVWNTMPAHTHDRRMEAYFYFDLQAGQTVCHFMGEPQETRHMWLTNHQAIICPPWSIHSGAGTSNYTFIWGMAGENLDYGDMDIVSPDQLR
ncbi:5-dehydro-4-deoxy-D-glucuronate isomerase [Mongoliitalea lutea]|uniref:4-deoxy-L-threo-5-hexosulose-uronate ketol-isomerase n=1 Tax=Mongoliitalea lutea TaxID=849756 RepID=A0A8J3CX22_9BACT|nr:5-dehydro-4-deoxy-D-glucuronate isomerase [Mongoliitalea lutea]GHB38825.1 4-deoxy-L-threo-5-hexosulose-uronate ketol-isomerase [Mongoliitalea lutea]